MKMMMVMQTIFVENHDAFAHAVGLSQDRTTFFERVAHPRNLVGGRAAFVRPDLLPPRGQEREHARVFCDYV
jgi:hypothetical protein